ncbi:MAG: calcium-binding protein [Pseudomonadota bacterium]
MATFIGSQTEFDIITGTDDADFILLPVNIVPVFGVEGANGFGGDDTIISFVAANLIGGDGEDTIIGSGELTSLDRDDGLFGGPDSDLIIPGGGNDVIYGDLDSSTAEDTGTDTLSYRNVAQVLVDLEANFARGSDVFGEAFQDQIFQIENIEGSRGNDILLGDEGANLILGFRGRDVANGREGNDTMIGGRGNDTFAGAEGNDELSGGRGNDQLVGGADEDLLSGGRGNDLLNGGGTEVDIIDGGIGPRDTVTYVDNFAGIFLDLATGVQGNAVVGGPEPFEQADLVTNVEDAIGSLAQDEIYGDGGGNVINGAAGPDQLFGRGGGDCLVGGDGNDTLEGGSGQDILFGQIGADLIRGGAGSDILSGGPPESDGPGAIVSDQFIFLNTDLAGTARDTIIDFELGIDRLAFDAGFFNPNLAIADALSFTNTSDGVILVADITGTAAGVGPVSFNDFVLLAGVSFDEDTIPQALSNGTIEII